MHLVEDLLGDGVAVDAPAAARRLGDGDGAILAHLRDRKADAVDVRHVLQSRLGEIAAGRLSAAFEQMPGKHARRHCVLVVSLPAKRRHDRAERERRVRDATGHDHVGAGRVGCGDCVRPEIRIGADDVGAELRDRLARFGEHRIGGAHQLGDIVAGHRGDLEFDAALSREPRNHARAFDRRGAARIGNEFRLMPGQRGQQHVEPPGKIVP